MNAKVVTTRTTLPDHVWKIKVCMYSYFSEQSKCLILTALYNTELFMNKIDTFQRSAVVLTNLEFTYI